jgi:hypothetical protein
MIWIDEVGSVNESNWNDDQIKPVVGGKKGC